MSQRAFSNLTIALGLLAMAQGVAAAPQDSLDRADPSIIEQNLADAPEEKRDAVTTTTANAAAGEIGPAATVLVGAVRVAGATMFEPANFATAIEPYLGRSVDPAGLRALAGAIAEVARARGYILATAWIPAQRIASGMVEVRLDEGRIDAVRVAGVANPALERTLAQLVTGEPVRRSELERVLLIAGDIHGIRVRDSRYLREGDRGVLVVRASKSRVDAYAFVDNHGSEAIGPVRARVAVDFNGLISSDDRLRLQGAITPFDPREFKLAGARYDKRLSPGGSEISLGGYYARARPGGVLDDRDIVGESHELSIGLAHPLARARTASLWTTAELAFRSVEQREKGIIRRDDKLTDLRIGFNGTAELADGNLWGGVIASRGLGLSGTTAPGDPLASRLDGSARFTKVEAYATWTRRFDEVVSAQLAGAGQIASRPLLASEEFGLGGPRFVRGYDYSERLGDEGIAGSAELRFDLGAVARPVRRLQLYVFADGGVASNIGTGRGGGSLASAGGGARIWATNRLWGTIEAAAPLTGERFDSGDRSPRLSATLGASF